MELKETGIPGCYDIDCRVLSDSRGRFVKTFHASMFNEKQLRTDWREEYYSVSAQGVIRGLHFQTPPAQHAKLVYCLAGAVLDVLLDLRRGSPAFGRPLALSLTAEKGNAIYIPAGVAHGFLSLTRDSLMQYKVTSEYSPEHDKGILWSSIGFVWPIDAPIVSERDAMHPALSNYDSPFKYGDAA